MRKPWSVSVCFIFSLALCTPIRASDACIPTTPPPVECYDTLDSCLSWAYDWYDARGVVCSAVAIISPERGAQCASLNTEAYNSARTDCYLDLVDCWVESACY